MRQRSVTIVGLGTVSESHLLAYRSLPYVRIIGVVEPRADRCREIAQLCGAPGYSSLELLLKDSRPDIACLLTPARTHRQLTELCASAGVHVLCEKPMAVTLEDAQAMAQACRKAGVHFFYGSSYRFLPAVQLARQLIAAGEIGSIRLIQEQVVGGSGAEAFTPMSEAHYPEGGPGGGGLGMVDHGIHMIDAFPWLCGSRVVAALGRGDRTGLTARTEFGVLMMENGALGVIVYDGSTWSAGLPPEGVINFGRRWIPGRGWVGETGTWDPAPGCITVYGSSGAMRIFHYANRLFVNKSGSLQERELSTLSTPLHFAEQLRQFCQNLDSGEAPATSAENGIEALRWLLAIYESEKEGSWQTAVVQ